jgi:cytochrome b involved in lipid metabolism
MQRQKSVGIIAGVVVFTLAVALALQQARGTTYTPQTNTDSPDLSVVQYSLSEVATHATGASCWSAINGDVYDLSAWIAAHPGGEEVILSICGKDGSAAFNNQHAGSGRPKATLPNFKIGTLTQ